METINPKNFIDIDPYIVSFITLKNGNMIMLDELAPIKPNKIKQSSEVEKNSNNQKKEIFQKNFELFLSEQFNLFFKGNQKKLEPITIIKKNDFNMISSITKNINFSFLYNKKPKKINLCNPNYSIDIKSSMFQSKRDKNNINNINNNINNININNLNNNILSEDNVNIHMTDTTMSNQTNINIKEKIISNENKKIQINPSNNYISNLTENDNYKLKQYNRLFDEKQKYTYEENKNNYTDININGNNIKNKENVNNNIIKNENNENNENNKNFKTNNIDNNTNGNNIKEKNTDNNNSLELKNNKYNNYISQNNFPKNNLTINNANKINLTESNNNFSNERRRSQIEKNNRLNKKIISKKDKNYVNAVVSLNIPADDQEEINLVKKFNSLVDRLNGQKSRVQPKINLRKSDRYYELYKNSNENNILNSILSPERNKRKKYILDFNNTTNNSKIGNKNISKIFYNELSMNNIGKGNNLNTRILALKKRTYTSINNSFRNENIKENYSCSNNSDIVLPSNFPNQKKNNNEI